MGCEAVHDGVHGHGEVVPLRLVAGEGGGGRGGGSLDDRGGEHLGVPQGIGDAVGGQRVLPPPGVPDQCPAGAVRLAQPRGQPAEEAHRAGGWPGREGGEASVEPRQQPALRLDRAAAAHRRGNRGRVPGDEHARQAAVGRDDPGREPVAVVPVVAVDVRCGPVAVEVGRCVGAARDVRCGDAARDQGVAPVSAHDEPCALGPGRAEAVAQDDADDAAGAVPGEVGHRRPVAQPGRRRPRLRRRARRRGRSGGVRRGRRRRRTASATPAGTRRRSGR